MNSQGGNTPKDKNEPYQQTEHAVKKGKACFAQTVQNAVQGAGDVHKRAEKAQNNDKASGKAALVEQVSKKSACAQKNGGT